MKLTRKLAAAGALSLAVITGTSSAAMAAPASTGFDDINQSITAGGSDTTYVVQTQLSDLYNASPGCKTDNTAASATLATCLTGASQDATYVGTNWDHDIITNVYPTGSGAGVRAVLDGVWNMARSSRGPSSGKTPSEATLGFYGFAKDGIEVFTLGGRAPFNISSDSIVKVYNCTYTTWGQIPEYGNASDTTPILPYGMNSSSGTKAVFDAYLKLKSGGSTTDTNGGSCVKKLADGTYPFENDTKPVIADAGANVANVIWFGSYGELKTFGYKTQSAQAFDIDGVQLNNGTIAASTYPISRYLYQVAKQTDVFPANASGAAFTSWNGATSGAAGGVRQYIDFLCKLSTKYPSTAINPYTGGGYYSEISSVISNNGFQRIPAAQRNYGLACRIDVATS